MLNNIVNVLADRWISPFRGKNDNRNYKFTRGSFSKREEFDFISKWVKKGDKVVDLGSGDGSLLKLLKEKGCDVMGVEISKSGVLSTQDKGIKVLQGRIDKKQIFKDNEFDIAICNVTIQMVMYPEILLKEMKRIARKQIITFPNFAFLPNRIDLLLNGRMPRIMIPGYNWYSTGHIHQFSIKDFEDHIKSMGLKVLANKHIYPGSSFMLTRKLSVGTGWMRKYPNLFASTAVFLIGSK